MYGEREGESITVPRIEIFSGLSERGGGEMLAQICVFDRHQLMLKRTGSS